VWARHSQASRASNQAPIDPADSIPRMVICVPPAPRGFQFAERVKVLIGEGQSDVPKDAHEIGMVNYLAQVQASRPHRFVRRRFQDCARQRDFALRNGAIEGAMRQSSWSMKQLPRIQQPRTLSIPPNMVNIRILTSGRQVGGP